MENQTLHMPAPWYLPSSNASSFPITCPSIADQALQTCRPPPPPTSWLLLILPVLTSFTFFAIAYHLLARPPVGSDSPNVWKAYEWPIIGSSLGFFWCRRDMLREGTAKSPTGIFSFFVGKKHVVSVSGEVGRKTFYESKDLNLSAGATGLLTGIPAAGNSAIRLGWLRYFIAGTRSEDGNWFKYFVRNVTTYTNGYNLARKLSILTSDVRSMCDELVAEEFSASTSGWKVFQPFDKFYELIYKLSFRMVGSVEFAEDRDRLRWAISTYRQLEENNNMTRIIFPWILTPMFLKNIYLAARLYLSYMSVIKRRQASGQRRDDATQYLLDRGDEPANIIKTQIGAIWAAGLTTAATASWLSVLLSTNPEWKDKCRAEVDAVVANHRSSPDQSARDILDSLTLAEWESEFPLMELCLREAIRVSMPGAVFRKNTSGSSVPIGETGQVIPDEAFVAFLSDNIHMDPNFYPEPQRFNPGRYLVEDSDKQKEAHTYVGWGCGRNPCRELPLLPKHLIDATPTSNVFTRSDPPAVGTRMAKLEVALTFSYLLSTFDFELSDQNGGLDFTAPPLPDRNNHKAQVCKTPTYLRYKLRKTVNLPVPAE